MGDWWFAFGLLLAIFGPVLLLVPVAVLYFVFRRIGIAARCGVTRHGAQGAVHVLLSLAAVAMVIAATWLPGRIEFARLCDALEEPRIDARIQVDGFYLDDSAANSFGQRYLREEGFAWMEARDIYHRDRFVRYRKDGDKIVNDPIPALTASHVVRSSLEQHAHGIHVARTEIAERATGKILAAAHSVVYHGGPLGLFLGVYGSANCPNPITAAGSRRFDTYYHLVREVLGGPDRPPARLKKTPPAP